MAWIFTSDGNYINFNGGGNLWRLHKDSNCISWHWDETGDLFFDVYDQEYTVKAGNIADVVIDGVPLSAASGFPAAIQAVFTGLSSPGGSSYLVYTALLSQSGTDAPVATVLENTLGGTVVWTYGDVGYFVGTLAGAFTIGKTVCIVGSSSNNKVGFADIGLHGNLNADYVEMLQSLYTNAASENGFTNVSIEIRVYP